MDAIFKEMGTAQLSTACGLQKQFIGLIVIGAEEGDIRLKRKKTKRKKEREQLDNCMEMRKDAEGEK